MRLLLLVCLCVGPALAESRLQQLLQRQRQAYPQAVVTSGFYDTRGVSRYRSLPGLHAGYDIAMPAGTPALAAWGGRVRSIVPWAPGEWGVVVEHADGSTATYGHIVPAVSAGQLLSVGQTVGKIARDHLDVKMRDGQGRLFDYGCARAVDLGAGSSVEVVPSPRALDFLRRLRALKEPAGGSGRALAVGSFGDELSELELRLSRLDLLDLKRINWTARDRAQAKSAAEELQSVRHRYDLGFVSRRRLEEAECWARLWTSARAQGRSKEEHLPPRPKNLLRTDCPRYLVEVSSDE